jgi:hypothetical protein
MFNNLKRFKSQRLKITTLPKPFSKRKIANEFAVSLIKDLKISGLNVLHETETNTKVALETKSGYSFSIKPDAIVLSDNHAKIYVEIKYMEEGIFNEPDTKKIAYDYLHFRQRYTDEFYVLISGAKLAAHRDVVPMLLTYTDRFFDINIRQKGWENRLKNMLLELQEMLVSKPERNYFMPLCFRDMKISSLLETKVHDFTEERSLSYATRKGIDFERKFRKRLEKEKISFEPKKGQLWREVELPSGQSIHIAADVWIPCFSNPKFAIECKNMERLTDTYAKTIAIDSVLLKSTIPHLEFLVVCGERTRSIAANFMKGYVDGIVTYDDIDFLFDYLHSFVK